jgi:hypothetical protein
MGKVLLRLVALGKDQGAVMQDKLFLGRTPLDPEDAASAPNVQVQQHFEQLPVYVHGIAIIGANGK